MPTDARSIPPLWAYMRALSGEDYHNAPTAGDRDEAVLTVNWRPDITPNMCLVYRDQWYRITRVDAFEGYKDDLRLYVSSMGTPKAADVVEWIDAIGV